MVKSELISSPPNPNAFGDPFRISGGSTYGDSLGSSDLKAATGDYTFGIASTGTYVEEFRASVESYDYVPLDAGLGVKYELDKGVNYHGAVADYLSGNADNINTGNAPAPAAPQVPVINPNPPTGENLAGQRVRIGGGLTPVNIVRTADGTIQAVDAETGHDFGTMHESSSGFGWSFDGQPVPQATAPAPGSNPVKQTDQRTPINSSLADFVTISGGVRVRF